MTNPVVIIGAGLSGLRAATLLTAQGIECRVLEARGRIGGRIFSSGVEDRPDLGTFDLGPTWFWPQHERVITKLVKELGLETIVQHTEGAMLSEQSRNRPAQRFLMPAEAIERSIRIVGGVQSLIDSLAATLSTGTVELDTSVNAIRLEGDGTVTLEANTSDGVRKKIRASAVILALPPRIVAHRIAFTPALSSDLMTSLVNKPTWMAGQAKVIAVYERPFWREEGLSGLVSSWVGPLQEIHDASPGTGSGALFGFFGMSAKVRRELGEERVLQLVVEQLTRLFGSAAEKMSGLLYKDWSSDPKTAVDEDLEPLRTFPSYGRLTAASPWGKKIIFAGTETSPEHGGHLEGALRSAERAVSEVLKSNKRHL